jgi:DNA repair protein RadA/Sms
MAKDKTLFSCTECGAWNTMVEAVAEPAAAARHRFASLAPAANSRKFEGLAIHPVERIEQALEVVRRFA